ncbi:calcium-binding protein [Roseovarius sp. S1116L3]|uniref:calcium-binding protein n=1 Tax=Roseovarius roseus TaxID=3342636 RepID=UPI00372A156A
MYQITLSTGGGAVWMAGNGLSGGLVILLDAQAYATFNNGADNDVASLFPISSISYSSFYTPPVNSAPTGSVSISGTAAEDQTLTASNTLTDADGLGTIAYQWQRGGSDISGATGGSYTLTQADVGAAITVVASYTDGGGTAESAASAATADVEPVGRSMTGTGENDRLIAGAGNDVINAGDGADTINGGDGDDTIFGGDSDADGGDFIVAGLGNDWVSGGHGDDFVFGMDGDDTIYGNEGRDELRGQGGNDVISGGAQTDLLDGGDGDDFLNGGYANDRLYGGSGGDRFYHEGVAGHGTDWIRDYSSAEGDRLVFRKFSADADDFVVSFELLPISWTGSGVI